MELKNIFEKIYPDQDISQITSLIEKYKLASILNNLLEHVKSAVEEMQTKEISTTTITAIATSLLAGVNNKLYIINNSDEKKDLELLISDIANELLCQLLQKYKRNKTQLLFEITESLKTTCEINGYNTDALLQIFPLDKITKWASNIESNSLEDIFTSPPIYYFWLASPHNLDELCYTLKDKKVIESIKNFKLLFKAPTNRIKVKFNASHKETIIVLFDILYDKQLISTKGRKGHFLPLKVYGVDFDNNILFQNDPKTIKYTVKKNKSKWLGINEKIEKWIIGFTKA